MVYLPPQKWKSSVKSGLRVDGSPISEKRLPWRTSVSFLAQAVLNTVHPLSAGAPWMDNKVHHNLIWAQLVSYKIYLRQISYWLLPPQSWCDWCCLRCMVRPSIKFFWRRKSVLIGQQRKRVSGFWTFPLYSAHQSDAVILQLDVFFLRFLFGYCTDSWYIMPTFVFCLVVHVIADGLLYFTAMTLSAFEAHNTSLVKVMDPSLSNITRYHCKSATLIYFPRIISNRNNCSQLAITCTEK